MIEPLLYKTPFYYKESKKRLRFGKNSFNSKQLLKLYFRKYVGVIFLPVSVFSRIEIQNE
jgi:hypothetical protein